MHSGCYTIVALGEPQHLSGMTTAIIAVLCYYCSTAHFPLLPSTVWLLQRRSIRRKIIQVLCVLGLGNGTAADLSAADEGPHPITLGTCLQGLFFGLAACIHVCSGLRIARSGLTSHFAPCSTSRVKPQIFEIFSLPLASSYAIRSWICMIGSLGGSVRPSTSGLRDVRGVSNGPYFYQ